MLHDPFQQQPVGLVLRKQLRQEAYSCSSPSYGFCGEARHGPREVRDHSFVTPRDGLLQRPIVQSGIREVEVHVLDLDNRIVYYETSPLQEPLERRDAPRKVEPRGVHRGSIFHDGPDGEGLARKQPRGPPRVSLQVELDGSVI